MMESMKMLKYTYEDGEPETDIVFTIDDVYRFDDQGPWIIMNLSVKTKEFSYHKTLSIDDYEIKDLAETILRFIKGEMKGFYEWFHIEGDIEIYFFRRAI